MYVFDVTRLSEHHRRNLDDVPEQSMREHIADFWAYNDLLDKATVPDPNRHFNYRWDDEKDSIGGKALDILKGK